MSNSNVKIERPTLTELQSLPMPRQQASAARGHRIEQNYFDETNSIIITWGFCDVRTVRPDLSDEQCMKVLRFLEETLISQEGIHLTRCANYCFPKTVENEEPTND